MGILSMVSAPGERGCLISDTDRGRGAAGCGPRTGLDGPCNRYHLNVLRFHVHRYISYIYLAKSSYYF